MNIIADFIIILPNQGLIQLQSRKQRGGNPQLKRTKL